MPPDSWSTGLVGGRRQRRRANFLFLRYEQTTSARVAPDPSVFDNSRVFRKPEAAVVFHALRAVVFHVRGAAQLVDLYDPVGDLVGGRRQWPRELSSRPPLSVR